MCSSSRTRSPFDRRACRAEPFTGIYPYLDYAEAGGLIAYGSDLAELWRRIANDLHQVLAKPSDIPIYQPTKFDFLINLKAAKALGLTIPRALLAIADEVNE